MTTEGTVRRKPEPVRCCYVSMLGGSFAPNTRNCSETPIILRGVISQSWVQREHEDVGFVMVERVPQNAMEE